MINNLGSFYFLYHPYDTNAAVFNICVQFFVWISIFISIRYIPRSGIYEYVNYVYHFEEVPNLFPRQLHHFLFPTAMRTPIFSHTHEHLSFIITPILEHEKWYLTVLICSSLMTNGVEHLFMCFFHIIKS